ncbi:hypothetical protein CVS40_12427 [Lucilia cuprina]|nr:hypothetical protein CVS40_12427 [Lucilia cuprina]
MSTLGGSRGERNAKPKFSALDINRMYKNSRGETTEPSAQKNQVPRKHGMQSLGKVPSARRPPANLPSLKAETTSSPIIANNNISGQEGGVQTPTSGNNPLKSTNITNNSSNNISSNSNNSNITANNINSSNSGSSLHKQYNSNSNNNNNNNSSSNSNNNSSSNSNSNSTVIGVGSKLINNSAPVGGKNSGSNHNQHHHNQQKPITWSAVTTGNDNQRGGKNTANVPPLYQSPQFQHEFPTLDGTVGGVGSGGNANAANRRSGGGAGERNERGGGDRDRDRGDQMHHHHHQQQQHHHSNSNHHQNYHHQRGGDYHHGGGGGGGRHQQQHHQQRNEAHNNYRASLWQRRKRRRSKSRHERNTAAWLQQQEKNAKGVAADNQANHQGQGPQQGAANNSGAAVPLPILALMPPFMQRGVPLPAGSGSGGGNGTSTGGSNMGRSQTPPNYQNGITKDSSSSSLNSRQQTRGNIQDYRSNSSNSSSAVKPNSNGGGGGVSGVNRKDKDYIIEPEVAQMQRPIIREEDLERLNAIANDDSWTKQDDIDYTKKLTFSDDESPEDTPTQERERPVFNKTNSGNLNDQRKNSNASGTSSITGGGAGAGNWQRKERDSLEREKSISGGDHIEDTRHQNGHRPSAGSVLVA